MSLSLTLTEAIDTVIQNFINQVAEKHDLDKNELRCLWDGEESKQKKTNTKPVDKPAEEKKEVDPTALLKCTKAELVSMCKSRNYKYSGTKISLMNRLLGKEDGTPSRSSKKAKKKVPPVKSTLVSKKLTANIPNILIRRNQFNNYEHPETGLVFDNESKVVIGKQNDDGSIEPLTEDDIDKCNAFKFKFNIPENLDSKTSLVEVKVDELEEDEGDELEIDEDEDEEYEEEELVEEELLGDEDEEEYEEEYITEDEG